MEFENIFADSHGITASNKKYIGLGLMYYTFVHALKAKKCLCIGSGSGVVPLMMRQAQIDMDNPNGIVYIIDANNGSGYGNPVWILNNRSAIENDPGFKLFMTTSDLCFSELLKAGEKFEYIHIDGDHSYEQSKKDFTNYARLLMPRGIITMHDSMFGELGVGKTIADIKSDGGYDVLTIPIAAGLTILTKKLI